MTTLPRHADCHRPAAIDAMRAGVRPHDLSPVAVHNALVRSACAYLNRGLTLLDWTTDLDRPGATLGAQASIGARGKPRTRTAHEKALRRAWEAAQKWIGSRPLPWTADDARGHARAIRDLIVADADQPLTDNERAVLAVACTVAGQVGSRAVNLPRRTLQEATGLGLTALRTALRRLEGSGLLTLTERGRSRRPGRPGQARANVYALLGPDALDAYLAATAGPPTQCRVNPAGGAPPHKAGGAPLDPGSGAPRTRQVVPPGTDDTEGPTMITLTLSAGSPEALAAALQAVASAGVTATPAEDVPARPRLRVVEGGQP